MNWDIGDSCNLGDVLHPQPRRMEKHLSAQRRDQPSLLR